GVVSSAPGLRGGVRPFGFPVGGTEFPTTDAVAAPAPMMRFDGPDPAAVPELAAYLARAATAAVEHVAPTSRDVAHRLHLLAAWLEARDKPADALVPAGEAAVRLRGLAAEEPGLRSMLAETASLLARLHARLDDLDAATRTAAEAVRHLRALTALDPGEHRARLAGQLPALGELLLADDRPEAALGPLQEAVCLTADERTAVQANARRLLGLCLDELGRTADGAAQLELAAELYEGDRPGLAAERYEGGRPGLVAGVRARLKRMRAAPDGHGGGRPWLLAMVARDPEQAVAGAERRLAECRQSVESAGVPGVEEIHAYLAAQATLARAWADAGRAGDGLALASQAAELLQRYPVPDRPATIAVGMVEAALGRSLAGLGRHKEAVPHLRTAIESYEPHTGTSAAFRTELAELLILETVALSRAGCLPDAEAAAERLVGLCEGLVADGLHAPPALAGALRLQAGIRLAGRNAEGALQSVTRALELTGDGPGLPAATCLELGGLCLAELGRPEAAREKLAQGASSWVEDGRVPPDLVDVHVAAMVTLAEAGRAEDGSAAGATLWSRILGMRPLPGMDVLERLVGVLGGVTGDISDLLPALPAFTDALEREAPLSGPGLKLHAAYGRCLSGFSDTAARAGDDGTARVAAELAVRVHRNLAAASDAYRTELGLALAALAKLGPADLAVMEQAIDLLGGQPADATGDATGRPDDPLRHTGTVLVDVLNRYAARLLEDGRAVEALAYCERAADLCDELDDPGLAAATYCGLGTGLTVLSRPQAALEAITWSLAELDRAEQARAELGHAAPDRGAVVGQEPARVRAQAIRARGKVLRGFGRTQEALEHLVEALELFTRLSDTQDAAETAATIADDLLASGRAEEAAEYARTATTAYAPGTVKHALATQRLATCHLMLGRLAEAHELVEGLIPLARRHPDDLTYRAILADSLAQSSELLPLLRLDGGTEAEARAREAIAVYDEVLAAGMDAQALHTGRAGACLTLASALRMQGMAADAVQPLREAVAALERHGPGHALLVGLLSRAMLMLGDALMEAGRALEAGLVFHRATQVTRDPMSRAVAHARLGLCQEELARDDAADAALRVSAQLLHDLMVTERDGGPAELLRDVLHGRLRLMERAGRDDEAKVVRDELRRLARP
ncbi:tetratricopeptide repeat protein, partial [Nonomuraea sp. KC401]|uniref:tetratricopeptide repeat protein n=2 Tax=unclassified Nonomuraea TaxID=2593643 RepID=UPI0010FEF7D7